MESRLPAHLEVAGLIRRVQAEGGFATVLQKGEHDAGTIMIVLTERGGHSRIYERMPQLDGARQWECSKKQDADNAREIGDFVSRRMVQDPDLWIVELDIAGGERFIEPS